MADESNMLSDGLKYASRMPLSYWLHNLLSSPARQCPTANPAGLGQVLSTTIETGRHGPGESPDFSMG